MKQEMKIRRMSEVPLQEVEWLWKPYIPFGKITIIQGDPGEGKTSSAKRKRSTDCLSKQKAEGKSPSAYTPTLFLR